MSNSDLLSSDRRRYNPMTKASAGMLAETIQNKYHLDGHLDVQCWVVRTMVDERPNYEIRSNIKIGAAP